MLEVGKLYTLGASTYRSCTNPANEECYNLGVYDPKSRAKGIGDAPIQIPVGAKVMLVKKTYRGRTSAEAIFLYKTELCVSMLTFFEVVAKRLEEDHA